MQLWTLVVSSISGEGALIVPLRLVRVCAMCAHPEPNMMLPLSLHSACPYLAQTGESEVKTIEKSSYCTAIALASSTGSFYRAFLRSH